MTTECPECCDRFEHLGTHWVQSSECDHPKLTQKQEEITTGLLMGDGCINYNGKNSYLVSHMISLKYLRYVDEKFGVLGTGVLLEKTAIENAKQKRDSGFAPDAEAGSYSDVYKWQSRRHPELNEFTKWYSNGKKVWPEDIELTPTVLKHWYCGDGHWNNSGTQNRIEISISNEREHTDKVDGLFEQVGLPSPSNYNIYEREGGSIDCNAEFTVSQSKELWEYMEEPIPGFEYKWPEQYK